LNGKEGSPSKGPRATAPPRNQGDGPAATGTTRRRAAASLPPPKLYRPPPCFPSSSAAACSPSSGSIYSRHHRLDEAASPRLVPRRRAPPGPSSGSVYSRRHRLDEATSPRTCEIPVRLFLACLFGSALWKSDSLLELIVFSVHNITLVHSVFQNQFHPDDTTETE